MNRILLLLLFCPLVCHAVIETPQDLPTVEALIKLHKTSAHIEKEALGNINKSLAITTQIKKKTIDVHEIKDILSSRSSSIYSHIVLASRLAYTSKELIELIKVFKNFTAATTSTLFSKPMCAWYYTEAVNACRKEIRNLQAMMLRLGASKLNLMRATMEEKLLLINTIQTGISNCKRILDNAYYWCTYFVQTGFHRLYLWDILNSEVTKDIANSIIKLYTDD